MDSVVNSFRFHFIKGRIKKQESSNRNSEDIYKMTEGK